MNNILKRTVSSVLAFAVAFSSVQLYGITASAAASGVKGDANSDGVVTEADLAVYESYFFNNDDIADDVIEDMDISYTGEAGYYAYISTNDYLAVKKYLAGETASVEVYDKYTSNETYGPYALYTGHEGSLDFGLSVDNTPCEDYEIVWNKEAPSGLDITAEGYLTGTPSSEDAGKTFKVMVIGKIDGQYAGAYQKSFTVYAPSFEITTEDGSFTYGDYIEITEPGTYNITSTDPASQVEATETICISENVDGGKVTLCLNGMNINYGDAYYPGDFIVSYNEQCDIDIVLSGSNVIRNAGVSLFTQGQVNLYGSDTDTLSLLGNSFLGAEYLTINGGDITVKNNSYCALGAYQLTMLGGSLDASFAPVEGATDNTSYTSLTGVGMECGIVTIRRGNLKLSGNEGAVNADSIEGIYISPLFCDIDISVSDDGTTYSAIEGSPFSDPDNAPSAYEGEGEQAVGDIPTNAINITDKVINKNGLKLSSTALYRYKVDITADDHGFVNYGGNTSSSNTFYVNGGEKLPSGITFTANEGWEIDKITASINGGAPVEVTDISAITINGDTVINVITKDVKAPVITGVENDKTYCIEAKFTVTDDSDFTVTVEGTEIQPDSNGVYTIVGEISSYSIIATDEFGNETIYTIVVYDKHPSLSNYIDNEDGTHTGVCDYCYEDVTEDHSLVDIWYEYDDKQHSRECKYCDYSELADHDTYYISNADGTHTEYCNYCEYDPTENHDWGNWYECAGRCERHCETCGDYDETDHVYGDWTDNYESGKHERECVNCGHVEEAEHSYDDWLPDTQADNHKRKCEDCGFVDAAEHKMNECSDYSSEKHIIKCEDCPYYEIKNHDFGEWKDNSETGMHERVCETCGHIEEAEHNMEEYSEYDTSTHIRYCIDCGSYYETEAHIYGDWEEIVDTNNHKRECQICGYTEYDSHNYGDWTDNHDTGKCERECEDCGRVQESEHAFSEWTDYGTEICVKECENCGHTEEANHIFSEWTDNHEVQMHERECEACGRIEAENHILSEFTDNHETGKHERECTVCGHIEEADHTFGDWTDNHDTGKCERECETCGHTEEAEHSYGDWTDNHETGYCERECETCGHIEEVDHDFSVWTENPETGEHERICSNCSRSESEAHIMGEWMFKNEEEHYRECNICNYTEEVGHDFGEWTDNHDTGKCEKICENCGHIEEADHTFGDWADNHETGKHERECTVCGHTEEAEHSYGEWTNNPNTGKHERECEVCDHTETEDHNFNRWIPDIRDGDHKRDCEDCGFVDAAEHKMNECSDYNSEKHIIKCEDCPYYRTKDHVFGEWVKNQETGKFEKECADCGHTEIADHAYGDWTDNPETGKHERTCAICGEIEEADHKMSEWTAAGGGEHKRECTACGRQEVEYHSAEYKEYSEHFHERLCTVCGDVAYGEHLYDAVYEGNEEHRILCTLCGYNVTVESCKGVWAEVKPATCTEEGEEAMICDTCGEEHTRVIEMLPHEFVNGRCSSCYMEDPTIGESSTNPPTGVAFGSGLVALIPASMMIFFARPKTKKK